MRSSSSLFLLRFLGRRTRKRGGVINCASRLIITCWRTRMAATWSNTGGGGNQTLANRVVLVEAFSPWTRNEQPSQCPVIRIQVVRFLLSYQECVPYEIHRHDYSYCEIVIFFFFFSTYLLEGRLEFARFQFSSNGGVGPCNALSACNPPMSCSTLTRLRDVALCNSKWRFPTGGMPLCHVSNAEEMIIAPRW